MLEREMTRGGAGSEIRIDVLGPMRVAVDGVPVHVPGPKRRALLALLAVAEGRAVTVDLLLDALWPAQIPDSGRALLHSQVSRLRGHLATAAARLETLDGGYRLALADGELDATRARRMLHDARVRAGGDPAGASALLRAARALWRGPPLAGLLDVAPLASTATNLARLHDEIIAVLIDCSVAAGEVDEAVDLATTAHATDPLREPAVLQLMRVLAAAGRAPVAMRTGREYRRRLAEEAGLDPSPALAALERDIAGGAAPAPAAAGERGAPPAAGRGSAPPPRPPAVRPPGPLIGRDAQVAALHRLIDAERLVTLVGPGGVGKTRVALEAARHADPTAVLLLAPVTDPAVIPHALAAALDLHVTSGDVLAACLALLAGTRGLLVVDNCEHLLDGVRDAVGAILDACPGMTVLATSREPLGLAVECTTRLAPLPVPSTELRSADDPAALADVPSVAVFLERAARVRPEWVPEPDDLRAVADIVRRVDGIPLAIELAAGRLSTLSPADLAARLDRSLDLLGGGRPSADARHRTLRDTIEWSYGLLPDDARRLFRHLAVFVDGCDLATAERVAAELDLATDPARVVAHLVDASMLEVDFAGPTRYRMLETLRSFALERLAAAGEDGAAADRLVRWGVDLAEWIHRTALTDGEPEADAALRRELPNLRAAWHLARRQARADDAARFVVALAETSDWRDLIEIRGWADELADDVAALGDHHRLAAAVLGAAANVAYMRGDHARAEELARTGLDRATDDAGAWHCLTALSLAALGRGDHAQAVDRALAAAEVATQDSENLGVAALAATYLGDLAGAAALQRRMAASAPSPTLRALAAYAAGEIDSAAGRTEAAEDHYARAIDLARRSGATFVVGIASVGLQTLRTTAGRSRDALRGYRELIGYWSRTGNWNHQWTTLRNLADLLRRLGDPVPAAQLDAAADRAPEAPVRPDRNAVASEGHLHPAGTSPPPTPDRTHVLRIAVQAIDRHLAGG